MKHHRCMVRLPLVIDAAMHTGGLVLANYILLREFFIVLGSDQDDLLCNDLYEESNMQLTMHLSGLP